MILSDGTIQRMVSEGKLISGNFFPASLTPNGYDLRIGSIKIGAGDPCQEGTANPGDHFLVSTMEEIHCPHDVSAQMFTRSSFARRGILGSFGFVDAGFRGQLTLSFYNSSSDPLKLKAGDRIAQIVFHRIDQPVERNYEQRSGNYQNSSGITVGGTASVKRD